MQVGLFISKGYLAVVLNGHNKIKTFISFIEIISQFARANFWFRSRFWVHLGYPIRLFKPKGKKTYKNCSKIRNQI